MSTSDFLDRNRARAEAFSTQIEDVEARYKLSAPTRRWLGVACIGGLGGCCIVCGGIVWVVFAMIVDGNGRTMGARLWSYVVDDETHVEHAFDNLKEREASSSSPINMMRVVRTPTPKPLDPAAIFSPGPDGVVVVSEEALAQITSSINTIYPMTDDELLTCLGTTKPTAHDVYTWMNRTDGDLAFIRRDEGRWALLYKDDRPHALWFVGFSGLGE